MAPLRKSEVKMNSKVSGLRSKDTGPAQRSAWGRVWEQQVSGLGCCEFGWCMFSLRFQSDIQRETSNGQQMSGMYKQCKLGNSY